MVKLVSVENVARLIWFAEAENNKFNLIYYGSRTFYINKNWGGKTFPAYLSESEDTLIKSANADMSNEFNTT